MAETPSEHESMAYWCYSCDKSVSVETSGDDLICFDCKGGFVESISSAAVLTSNATRAVSHPSDDSVYGNQFIRMIRLIAQAAREEDAPPSPQSGPSDEGDLRVGLDRWNNNDEEDDDGDEHSVEVREDENIRNREEGIENQDGSEDEDDDDDDDAEIRRRRRDLLRLRLRDLAARAASRRERILDWAEILMGLEDNSIELRLQVPEADTYVGNPGDYVDAAGYEALLQNLAESDTGGKRGAPPAAKAAVDGLGSLVIEKEGEVLECAICRDHVKVGDIAKKLPCGHAYHGECIEAWLGSRNSCPVCRFELPTDDPEYEEERKKKVVMESLRAASSSSSGGGGNGSSDSD